MPNSPGPLFSRTSKGKGWSATWFHYPHLIPTTDSNVLVMCLTKSVKNGGFSCPPLEPSSLQQFE